jgi:hypothetical protein
MNQSVISFASEAARNAALTAPLEGQLVWLEDSNKYVYYSGSAWVDLLVPASSGNAIINGSFEINQRNFTSTTTNGAYGFDRFKGDFSSGVTYSAQSFTPGAAPVAGYEAANFARVVTTGQTGSSVFSFFYQPVEDVRTFAGQTVTYSFWAKAATGTPKIYVELDQQFGTGGSARVLTAGSSLTLTTSWARYSVTIAVPSISGKTVGTGSWIAMHMWVSAGTDFNARTGSLGIQSNTFDIWGVQLESGSSATPFRRNANSIQGELAACQRYYIRYSAGSTSSNFSSSAGAQSSSQAYGWFSLPVEMRVPATSVEFSAVAFVDVGDNVFAMSGIGMPGTVANTKSIQIFGSISGATAFRPGRIGANNNANAFIGFSAEL